ncbi:MAG: reverse transcriptase domain-containing protein [Pseudonocardiaceae bacterium]
MPLLSEKHLRLALRQCGHRASAPGGDRMTWAALRRDALRLLPLLAAQLAEGTWQPGAFRPVSILTYTGKQFLAAVPPVRDRLVQRAMRNAMEPIFEARAFAAWVSGFRPRRNRISALRQATVHVDAGYRWVADVDVASVSEGATVEDVIGWIARYVHDGTFLARVRTALAVLPSPIAPGSGLAPLLINLRLSQVDSELAGLPVVRFADNYCAFARTRSEAVEAFARIGEALARQRLKPNAAKSRLREDVCVEDLFLIGG